MHIMSHVKILNYNKLYSCIQNVCLYLVLYSTSTLPWTLSRRVTRYCVIEHARCIVSRKHFCTIFCNVFFIWKLYVVMWGAVIHRPERYFFTKPNLASIQIQTRLRDEVLLLRQDLLSQSQTLSITV